MSDEVKLLPCEELVERVARAIAAEDNEEDYDAWEANPSELGRRVWYEYARAAIAAMSRPTTVVTAQDSSGASVPDQALAVPAGPVARPSPSGFDPSRWLEIRPDSKGEFDEVYARFADGMFCLETMTDKSVWIGLECDDGRYFHLWISSSGKLRYTHEDGDGDPPRFTASGVDRKPWLASGTLTEGGDAKQAPGDSLSGPTAESGDAQ
jgi:hypothetical protein